LGFVLNSEDMTVTLPEERKQKVLLACSELERKHNHKRTGTSYWPVGSNLSSSFVGAAVLQEFRQSQVNSTIGFCRQF